MLNEKSLLTASQLAGVIARISHHTDTIIGWFNAISVVFLSIWIREPCCRLECCPPVIVRMRRRWTLSLPTTPVPRSELRP